MSCPLGVQAGTPKYRCRDCFSMRLVCADCCREAHKEHPLHVIEVRRFLAHPSLLSADQISRDGMMFISIVLLSRPLVYAYNLGIPQTNTAQTLELATVTSLFFTPTDFTLYRSTSATALLQLALGGSSSFDRNGTPPRIPTLRRVSPSDSSNNSICRLCRERSLHTTITRRWRN